MDWLFLAALGIIWTAFLLPSDRRRVSPQASVEDFERKMQLLAETEGRGRFIIAPRKGARFLGTRGRARARARERRRQVFVFLVESIGLTLLIGLVPPLRVMWDVSVGLAALLAVYVWVLIAIKEGSPRARARRVAEEAATARPRTAAHATAGRRYVAEGHSRTPRPAFKGLGSAGEGDVIRIVVRPREVGVAGA